MFLQRLISYSLVLVLISPMVVFAISSYDVATYAATNACQSGATLNGYVNPFFTTDTNRWFEWGTSRDYLQNGTNQTRNGNNTEYFSQDIINLTPNTTYYFRVVAQNSKGIGRGEVLSFKTDGSVSCTTRSVVSVNSLGNSVSGAGNTANTNTSYVSQSVITKRATDIMDTSARLNAVALPLGSTQTSGWFEWGSTPDFGNTTASQPLGTGNSTPWSAVISGLKPGTTYFFKPVIENQNGVSEGVLFSFHTSGVASLAPTTPVVSNTSNISNQSASALQPVLKKTTPKPTTASVSTDKKTAGTIGVEVVPSTDTAALEERVSETVQFENTTGATLKNVAVRVVLPCDVVYVPTGGDSFLKTGQMLTHEIGAVKPNQKISLLLWMYVGENTPNKTPIETIAVVNWQDATPSSYTQSVGRSVVTVDTSRVAAKENVAAAESAKSAYSIFPASLKDWGVVIGFLFLLFAAYMVFLVMRRDDSIENEEVAETVPTAVENQNGIPGLHAVGVPHRKYTNNDPFVTDTNREKTKTVIPVVPLKKVATEKGAPPENLPI